MSFLTAIPEELLAAAQQLEGIGNSLTAQNAGIAAPTTAVAPAASDQVSALQAAIFSTYGTMYQQIAAEAQAIQQQFVSTLGLSSGTYAQTEAANVAAATPTDLVNQFSTLFGGPLGSTNGLPTSLSSNSANFLNIGVGNYASACSDLLGMAGGGLLPAASGDAADAAGDAAGAAGAAAAVSVTTPAGTGMGGMAAAPMAGMGQATMVGRLSTPPSWAGTLTSSVSPATAAQTVGWTAAAPQAGTGTIVPGMPGMGAGARNSAGFGAPRYGVKPIVMPKPKAV
ncbi:PPE family protein, SVP subgroup [Mycobacterium sp. Marseille-P9652]|uniref:PPE family protein, SVP subgroup n=1 Tax=Mycobacterium sp. Marseille-P9652 TaxID=2654950 RepID=UPI0012E89CE2|nr:PE domain-containing protein [Mycobacterium sp. Marseille-P9652]